jgi:diguanylate cyclase (GGDEF)-like protein
VRSLLEAAAAGAPAVTGAASVAALLLLGPSIGADLRLAVAIVGAASIGAAVGSALSLLWMHRRFGRLVLRAERLGASMAGSSGGDPGVLPVPAPHVVGLATRLELALGDLAARLTRAYHEARVDPLTGVASRSALLTALIAEVERAGRYDRPLSIAFVDVDDFKAINDTWGHAAGDSVLRGIAQELRANLRASDLVGRYGGEEFLLVLSETGPREAGLLADRLRTLVGQRRFSVVPNVDVAVSISIGIAGARGRDLQVDALIHDADAAMYSAKAIGRDHVRVFTGAGGESVLARRPRPSVASVAGAGSSAPIRLPRPSATMPDTTGSPLQVRLTTP